MSRFGGGMGMGGMGMGGYGGMGGMGGSMYGGMGGMGGGGMYGGMYGNNPYGSEQSGGMMALERLSMLVNSLCFTTETIERSMHSMNFFWESLVRIKGWAYQGIIKIIRWNKKKLKGILNVFLYMIGRRNSLKNTIPVKVLLLNIIVAFIAIHMGKFAYRELTRPSAPVRQQVMNSFY
jgi:hypothetical protein